MLWRRAGLSLELLVGWLVDLTKSRLHLTSPTVNKEHVVKKQKTIIGHISFTRLAWDQAGILTDTFNFLQGSRACLEGSKCPLKLHKFKTSYKDRLVTSFLLPSSCRAGWTLHLSIPEYRGICCGLETTKGAGENPQD